MASMGFSYAQIHVRQEKVRSRVSKQVAATTAKNKAMAEEEEEENKKTKSLVSDEEKAVRNSRTTGRVHPCASSTAAASSPMGGHR
jgi:hypothetical protein